MFCSGCFYFLLPFPRVFSAVADWTLLLVLLQDNVRNEILNLSSCQLLILSSLHLLKLARK